MGEGWINAVHPEYRERMFKEWEESARSTGLIEMKYRFKTARSKITRLSGRARAVYESRGEVTEYIGTTSDITKQKQAEGALKESERKLSTLIANIQGLNATAHRDKGQSLS